MTKADPRRRILQARPILTGTALAALVLVSPPVADEARAQDGLLGLVGGLSATADLSFGLEFSDDEGDSETVLSSDVLFTLSSVTRTQALSIAAGAELDFGDEIGPDGDNYELRPNGSFDYVFNNGSTELTLGADIATREIDGAFDDDGLDATALIEDDGTRVDTDLAFGIAVGLDAPVGASFDYTRDETSFEDTVDPDLTDSVTETYQAVVTLRPSRTLSFSLSGLMSEETEEDAAATTQEITRYGLATDWQATPILGVTASIGQAEIVTTAMGVTRVIDGAEGALGFTLDQRNGSYSLDLSRELTVNGPLDRISAGRDLTLSNDASLALSLGVAEFDMGDTVVIGSVIYSQPTRSGSLDLSLRQEADVDSDDADIRRTVLSAGYTHDINRISSISFDASYAEIEELMAGIETTARDLDVTYTRALGQNWAFNAGVGFSERTETGAATTQDREAFLTLERTFSWRP